MKVTVTFRHMDVDENIREYADEKITKLAKKYLQRPKDAQVVLTAEKFRRIAEISLKGDTANFLGKEENDDLRAAIDLVMDKLEIQARKHRQKFKNRKKGGDNGSFSVLQHTEKDELDEDFEPSVIRDDRFVPKPLSVEDAILLIEDSKDDFLVFRNQDSMNICVLYRRPDKNYGLIEPE
jgi:ribosome hibernation promoting factor